MILLACVMGAGMLQAQEAQSSLVTAKLEVYPKEIYYGDIFFNRVKVHNGTEKTIWFSIHNRPYYGTNVVLKQNDLQVYQWWGGLDLWSREFFPISYLREPGRGDALAPFHEVAAHATESVFLRPLWFPMLEFSDTPEALELEKAVSSGKQQYLVKFSTKYEEDSEKDFTSSIIVKPRPREDFELLREWFLELPTTKNNLIMWTEDAVFTAPLYTRGSPIQTKVYSREEAEEKRWPFVSEYGKFIKPFLSRTPEALARIKRTNELAARILERAKEPDSTFSQNMIEFIQLRGFLVDMCYAENPEAEEAAFVKMMDFIDQSQDKELWIDFMYDVGLESIENRYVSYKKVFEYRQRFAEHMQIKKLCHSFEDYLQIYGFSKKGED